MDRLHDVEALANMSAHELDLLLGEVQLADAPGSKQATDADKIEVGRSYFSEMLPALRERVCKSEMIADLFAKKYKERNEIYAAAHR